MSLRKDKHSRTAALAAWYSDSCVEFAGILLHLAQCTRPDIAQAVGVLARYSRHPTKVHADALRQLARYVAHTRTYGITYGGSDDALALWADANLGGDLDSRRSCTGYVAMLYGGAISWASKLQDTAANSTQESEYQAANAAVRECLSLRKLMPELGVALMGPLQVYGDNQAALCLLKDHREGERVKHIDISHHFTRERVLRGEVHFTHCASEDNLADGFTKALAEPALRKGLLGWGVGCLLRRNRVIPLAS
jgi:hypothetical protein